MSENERLLEAISEGLDGIWIPLWIVDACDGDMNAARMLARLMFWFGKGRDGQIRARLVHKGHRWVAKRHDDWWDEARLGEHQAKRAALKLVSLGLADVDHFIFSGMRTAHYRLLADGIARAVSADPHPAVGANPHPAVGADLDVAVSAELAPPVTEDTSPDTADNPLPSGSGEGIPDTGNDTDATSASALIDEEAAPSRLDHWAGGSAAFNALADQVAKWMGKAPEGLHPATAKAIKSGAGRLLAREITAEDISATYGRRWFREHWAGGDRSKTVVDRSPRNLRQIEDWVAMCDATPEPADRVAIDEALAASASASAGTPTQPDPLTVHPWLADAVAQASARPGSTFERWFAAARLVEIEDGVAVVQVPDEAAAAMLSSRPGALVWPPESGATATRFVAAVA